MAYKKMAGTSAVFVDETIIRGGALDRNGMSWSAEELHGDDVPKKLTRKSPMANSLALEGLEEYDPPSHGDVRALQCINEDFVYIQSAKAWVQLLKTQ